MANSTAGQVLELDGMRFELAEFLREGEKSITNTEMIIRAKALGSVTGESHMTLFTRHESEIPEEWRKFNLFFPQEVWREVRLRLDESPYIWYLEWLPNPRNQLPSGWWVPQRTHFDKWGADSRIVRLLPASA